MKIPLLSLLLILPAVSFAESSAALSSRPVSEPRTFLAEYVAEYDGLPIKAKGVRELQKLEDGQYRLTSTATSVLASVTESSEFRVNQAQLAPNRYEYTRGGLGKNKRAFLTFNYEDNTIAHEDGTSALTENTLDKLSYQYQLKLDLANLALLADSRDSFEYIVADGDKLKRYRFRLVGEETLSTPAGNIATIKLERIRDQGVDRQTSFWLARDLDYLLVRLRQQEKGKGFELNLASFKFNES